MREVASSISTVNEMIDSQTKSIRDSSASVGQLVKNIEQIREICAASQESSTAFSDVSSRIQETDVLVQSVRSSLEAVQESMANMSD